MAAVLSERSISTSIDKCLISFHNRRLIKAISFGHRTFFKEPAMLNNYVVQHKNNDTAIHNYCIMHIFKIMHVSLFYAGIHNYSTWLPLKKRSKSAEVIRRWPKSSGFTKLYAAGYKIKTNVTCQNIKP